MITDNDDDELELFFEQFASTLPFCSHITNFDVILLVNFAFKRKIDNNQNYRKLNFFQLIIELFSH